MSVSNSLCSSFFFELKPVSKLSVSQFANKYTYIPSEYAAEAGKYSSDRAPYQKEMMDVATQEDCHTAVYMTSAQVGKSTVIDNIMDYGIAEDPAPMLVVYPTLDDCKDYSQTRFRPRIRETPILNKVFNYDSDHSKVSGDSIYKKIFPGGRISFVGSNSPSGLSRISVKRVLFDEIDRFTSSKEGDPIKMGIKRAVTYFDRFIAMSSTPTIEGSSRIDEEYKKSDMRKYYVRCPHCKAEQILKFHNLVWQKNKKREPILDTVKYECEHCSKLIDQNKKRKMLESGRWIAGKPFKGIAGFWINELYSPWVSWSEMVYDFYEAKKTRGGMQAFVNLSLGETWKEEGITIDENAVFARREDYGDTYDVPSGGRILVAAVDVQHDRLEGEIVAYGAGEESWGIDYFIIPGSPGLSSTWDLLYNKLTGEWKHQNGEYMRVVLALIDAGDGNYTKNVYQFTKKNEVMRWFSCKGSPTIAAPLVKTKPSIVGTEKAKLYIVGTDTAKQLIYSRLQLQDQSAEGFMHFPKKYTQEYFKQLTAEEAITKTDKSGYSYRKWIKRRNRNEALDIRVYSLAAINILRPNWKGLENKVFTGKVAEKKQRTFKNKYHN